MLREWIKENTKSDGTTIIVNENISILPPRTFDGMTNLQEVVLPKNLKKIKYKKLNNTSCLIKAFK